MGNLGFVLEFQGDPFDPEAVTLAATDASQIPELRKHARLWQQLEAYLQETASGTLPIAEIPDLLDLDKSRRETFRNYVWALKNNTNKYKKLAELMYVVGDDLCLVGHTTIESLQPLEEEVALAITDYEADLHEESKEVII